MPDMSEAELAELETRAAESHPFFAMSDCRKLLKLTAEVRRLRAENAELRKRAEWRETFTLKDELRVTHEPGKEPTTSAIELEKR